MSAGYDPTLCLTVPGRLVLGPTNLGPLVGPTLPGVAILNTGTQSLTPGVHYAALSFVFPTGETLLGTPAAFTVNAPGHNVMADLNLTLTLPTGAVATNLYMTHAGATSTGPYYFVVQTQQTGTFVFNFSWANLDAVYTLPYPLVPGGGPVLSSYPFGGTPVGIVSRARLVREQSYALANSEALGRDGVSAYGGRFKASVSAVLVQRDKTILNALYA